MIGAAPAWILATPGWGADAGLVEGKGEGADGGGDGSADVSMSVSVLGSPGLEER